MNNLTVYKFIRDGIEVPNLTEFVLELSDRFNTNKFIVELILKEDYDELKKQNEILKQKLISVGYDEYEEFE